MINKIINEFAQEYMQFAPATQKEILENLNYHITEYVENNYGELSPEEWVEIEASIRDMFYPEMVDYVAEDIRKQSNRITSYKELCEFLESIPDKAKETFKSYWGISDIPEDDIVYITSSIENNIYLKKNRKFAVPFKILLNNFNGTAVAFSKEFNIPCRTIQNWVAGSRTCPEYVLELIEFKLKHIGGN